MAGYKPSWSECVLDFCLFKQETYEAVATLALDGSGKAMSMPEATVGGIWSNRTLEVEVMKFFLESILEELKARGITSVDITVAPKPYQGMTDLISYLLFFLEFRQREFSVHYFFLGKKKIKSAFRDKELWLRKKLKKERLSVEKSGIHNFGFLEDLNRWVPESAEENRLDLGPLIEWVAEFPERFYLCSLTKHGEAVGHCLSIRLTSDCLYLLWAAIDPKNSLKYGEEILLLQLLQLAVDLKVSVIDFGVVDFTSASNHRLKLFKSKFSNDISGKVTWTREL